MSWSDVWDVAVFACALILVGLASLLVVIFGLVVNVSGLVLSGVLLGLAVADAFVVYNLTGEADERGEGLRRRAPRRL